MFGYFLLTNAGKPFGDRVVHRRAYMVYDVVQSFLSMFTGLITALVRMILAIAMAVITLPRLDRSAMPAWVSRYLNLDTGACRFECRTMRCPPRN
jgi:hypothetical protein